MTKQDLIELEYKSTLVNDFKRFQDASIMMVDDELLVMEVLQIHLEQQGYRNFTLIEDSRTAFDAIKTDRPDVLLLDLNMPHVTGFDLLELIRTDPSTRFLSVIVLTSASDSATKLKALELGATDFLAKPVDSSELALRLRNTLAVKAYQDQLAYYDPLTRLPNRSLFLDRLELALNLADRSKESVAMMLISLDRFDTVRDTLGPTASDNLITQVSNRLLKALRNTDTVSHVSLMDDNKQLARVSTQEFSVLLPGIPQVERLSSVAERLRNSFQAPFNLDGNEVFITGSIGIALYPDDAQTGEELIKNASAATAQAKAKGRDVHQFYSEQMDVASKERLSLETALRRALEKEEFCLFYQPQICANTGKLIGAEALLRWNMNGEGLIPPFKFIPLAEELGLIKEIGRWVIVEVCKQASAWSQRGLNDLQYSVNVSTLQLSDSLLPVTIEQALVENKVAANHLMIEITESALLGNREMANELLALVKSIGAQLSIDDFGTDYASLSYLRDFSMDELKIDRSFVKDILNSTQDQAIVNSVINLAHDLGLKVVAEGVEDKSQLDYLKSLKCDVIQGFYYAKPMPPEEFYEFWLSRS